MKRSNDVQRASLGGWRTRFLSLLACVMPMMSCAQGMPEVTFSNEMALRGRHPEIVRQDLYLAWSRKHGIGAWHEVRDPQSQHMTVAVQANDDSSVLAAMVMMPPEQPLASARLKRIEVIETAGTDKARPAVDKLVSGFAKQDGIGRLHAIRPSIQWGESKATLTWEAEFVAPTRRSIFSIDSGKLSLKSASPVAPAKSGSPAPPGVSDDLSSNELHHPEDFKAEATSWIGSASAVQDKARRIFERVEASYSYDSNIVHIDVFTWADTLVRDTNGRSGICDEWTVVSISYLRSVGIPARLKFIAWKNAAGKDEAHAALEYNDGGTWRHMDALWHAFNDAGVYRRSGATNVTVMDGDYPLDSRWTSPAWGVPDPTGDLKLYPYGDPVIHPSYPGEKRPGYSY